jgi:probable HAF family extracellular repeat protein
MTHFYAVIDLGTLPGGHSSSAAALNDFGQVVGSSDVAGSKNHSFLWTAGALQNLGTLPGGSHSGASGISTCAQVAGQSDFTGSILMPSSGALEVYKIWVRSLATTEVLRLQSMRAAR